MKLVRIYDGKGEVIDRGMVVVFKAPRSYTGEDMVEFHIHGNPVIASTLVSHIISLGARLAEPGEFTKRALISGKMTLAQVEALHEVIYGNNIEAIKAATRSVLGSYISEVESIYNDILSLSSAMIVDVDYPEDVELEEYGFSEKNREFLKSIDRLLEKLQVMYERVEVGRKMARGYKIVLVGAPNVGKSSLLNVLLGYERAIVSDIPGTTRDFIETMHMIGDIPVSLIDVAGIRHTNDEIEKIGVDRARKVASEADLLIWVIDGSVGLRDEDELVWKEFGHRIGIIVVNKMDLVESIDDIALQLKPFNKPIVYVSTKTEEGIQELIEQITDILTQYDYEPLYMSGRVVSHLRQAISYLEEARKLVETNMPEIASIDIERAAQNIGAILGKAEVSEDILDKLFSTFCVGK